MINIIYTSILCGYLLPYFIIYGLYPCQQVVSEDRKSELCQYVDGIISTMHPGYSDDGSQVIQRSSGKECPHPAKKSPLEVEDAYQDLIDCVAATQIHVCKPNHCLKSAANNCQTCRFQFPKPLAASTDLLADEKTGELDVVTKKNHSYVNNYSRSGLQAWRANMDIQMVTSSSKLKRYATKMISYSTKAEPASKQSKAIFDAVAENSNKDEAKVVNAVLMNAVGGRDYGAQEVCTLLSGDPLVTTSRQFVIISMNQNRELREQLNPGEEVTVANIIDMYTQRPEKLDLISLFEYAASYTVKKKNPANVCKRPKDAIVMHFPFLINDPNSDQYEDYCRIQVNLHIPFRVESDLKDEGESWSDAYRKSSIYEAHQVIDLKNDEKDASNCDDPEAAEIVPNWAFLCDDQMDPAEVRLNHVCN